MIMQFTYYKHILLIIFQSTPIDQVCTHERNPVQTHVLEAFLTYSQSLAQTLLLLTVLKRGTHFINKPLCPRKGVRVLYR